MYTLQDPKSGMILPREFVDQKAALKKVIDDLVDKAVNETKLDSNYFLTLHMKFDELGSFSVSAPISSTKIPPFTSNQFVFWVSPSKGICELLWMVPAKKPGEKLKVEFNTSGVAYLQAKGAMPK